MPDGYDYRTDPAFKVASPADQDAYLQKADPDYAKASPQDRAAYLALFRGGGQQTASQPSPFTAGFSQASGFKEADPTLPQMAGETLSGLRSAIQRSYAQSRSATGENKGTPIVGTPFADALTIPNLMANGIEGMASGVERGVGDVFTPGKRQFGAGELLAALSQVASGTHAPDVPLEVADTAAKSLRRIQGVAGDVRDATAPKVPPGLSAEATANLREAAARRGTQNVFRAASPSSGDVGFRETLSKAAPDLAKMAREVPLKKSGGFINPDFRPREFVDNAKTYMNNIWQNQREPQIAKNANVRVDLTPVRNAGVGSITQMDIEKSLPSTKAVQAEIGRMPQSETLRQLDTRRAYLSDKLDNYMKMTPSDKVMAQTLQPVIDSTRAQYRAVLDLIDQTLQAKGETGVREFGRRYGNLAEVKDAIQKQMNSAERVTSIRNLPRMFFMRGPLRVGSSELVDPSVGRLLQRGLRQLARTNLNPTQR